MKMNRKTALLVLSSFLAGLSLNGCASSQQGKIVNHSFEFNAHLDSPEVQVLNYEYSTQKPDRDQLLGVGGNGVPQASHISGGFPRGDFVYMKWRIRSTGEEYEDRVDLRGRLPADISNQRIYCVLDGAQLYVLLTPLDYYRQKVSTEEMTKVRAEANTPLKRFLAWNLLYRVKQIYPDPITQLR